jgi:hypothetical protein
VSVHFTAWCLLHEVEGPDVRLGAGHTVLVPGSGSTGRADTGEDAWRSFLREHEWCPIMLAREDGRPPHSQGPRTPAEAHVELSALVPDLPARYGAWAAHHGG